MSVPRGRSRVRRRRRDTPSVRRNLLLGGATLAFCAIVVYVGLTAYNGVPGRSYSTLYVEVPQIGNLITHDPVRISGVRVGQVQTSDTHGSVARVKLQLEPGVRVPVDTTVRVRSNGLLGARYVQLIPGSAPRLFASGATVRSASDVMSNGLPETLDTLDARTRGGLHAVIGSLGEGMLSRGEDLNAGIRSASAGVEPFLRLSDRLLHPSSRLDELTPSLLAGVTPLNASRTEIAATIPRLDKTLRPLVDRRIAVQTTLSEAPGTLTALDAGLRRGEVLLASARALAREARATLPVVPAGLSATTRFLRTAPRPLARTNRLLRAAESAVPAVLRITTSAKPVLEPLRQTMRHASPILEGTAPYGCDIVQFAINFRSMTGFGGPGSGSTGPLMGFRAQVVPSPEVLSQLGKIGPSGQATSRTYDAPCAHAATEYPLVVPRVPLRKGGQ